MRKLSVLIILLTVSLLFTNVAQAQPTHYMTIDCFAATSEKAFDMLSNYMLQNDKQAVYRLMLQGGCVTLDKGEEVYIVDQHWTTVEVRRPGRTEALWLPIEWVKGLR